MGKIFLNLLDTMGRPGPGGHSQGDPPYDAYPRGRPVIDDIATVGEVLLRDDGYGKTDGVGRYIGELQSEVGRGTIGVLGRMLRILYSEE